MSEQCKKQVWTGFHMHPCSRKATKDGYCTQHHPDSVAKRRLKSIEDDKAKYYHSVYGRLERAQTRIAELEGQIDQIETLVDKIRYAGHPGMEQHYLKLLLDMFDADSAELKALEQKV